MASTMSQRELAESRAIASGKVMSSWKDAGKGAIRSLDLNVIMEGDVLTVPENYKVFTEKRMIGNTEATLVYTITEEGKQLFPSVFTRGVMPADGSEYVRPSGSVVDKCQEYGSMDDFFKKELAGKKIKFTKRTRILGRGFNGGEPSEQTAWQIDFAA